MTGMTMTTEQAAAGANMAHDQATDEIEMTGVC
jgi:hypothetical protein